DLDRAGGEPQRALDSARNNGRFEAQSWRVRKDGSRFRALVVIDPIIDAAGNAAGYAVVESDLGARNRTVEALRSSEEQFRRLVQGVVDYAIYMLDPNGIVANWNAGAERIKGYKAEEVVGKPFSIFYTPEDQAMGEPEKALETARREGRVERE